MWGKISPGFRGNSPNTGWAWIVIPNLCASHRISSIVVNQSSTAMWWAKSLGRCWHFAQHSLFVSFSYHTFSHMPCCRWLDSGRFEGISLQDLHFIASRVVVYLAQKIERMNVNGLALFLRADGHKKKLSSSQCICVAATKPVNSGSNQQNIGRNFIISTYICSFTLYWPSLTLNLDPRFSFN